MFTLAQIFLMATHNSFARSWLEIRCEATVDLSLRRSPYAKTFLRVGRSAVGNSLESPTILLPDECLVLCFNLFSV